MIPEIIEDKIFAKVTAEAITGRKRTFENCKFINCDFSYADIAGVVFMECQFEGCNLSLIKLTEAGLQNITFKDCKLSGADFSKSRDFLFEVNFNNCILDNAIFYKKKNKGAKFTDCSLVETDFTEADLTDVQFINCNLNRAFFNRTTLKNADLRTSYNFIIDPDINMLKKARFSVHGLPGLLAKYDIRIEG
ncbi:MAG TPA: pentapeptide repeat-containing protein [Mucilaginibacter sp.]|jgi:fluoroquinolone resistance protein|nr:pentapeptide repeat-containing protein [Mucilaginibacter sp.]